MLTSPKYVISAMQGGAGAGGVMMALGADKVFAHEGTVMNPHYRSMGLYGSEYWTYSLPKRCALVLAGVCLFWHVLNEGRATAESARPWRWS